LGHTRYGGLMLTRYRVDNVPWALRPFYLGGAWALGLVFYLYYCLCRATSQISLKGPGSRDLSQHAIFCLWHENWWLYFVVLLRHASAQTMINHPAAYMKPIHVVLRLMGMKHLRLGSSGEEGRQAANEVARLVKEGYSTTISPDGPYGPPQVLKKGVLHMALQSGAPIVPLTMSSSRFVHWPSWDSKKLPLPFSQINMTVHKAILVSPDNLEESSAKIVRALGTRNKAGSKNTAG
jgi:lysophospholipid acyltransferase (LPLAT)-like uncharacterized protein